MRRLLLMLALALAVQPAAIGQVLDLELPSVVLSDIGFDARLVVDDSLGVDAYQLQTAAGVVAFEADDDGMWVASGAVLSGTGRQEVQVVRQGRIAATGSTRSLPGWLSILPPLIAILIALAFKRVIPALFVGIWMGAAMATQFSFYGLWKGLLNTLQIYVLEALSDPDHAAIILFSLMIGGMVGIIQKNGGTQGVVNIIVRWARSPGRGQTSTAMLGLAIFFDDYANTLVVGNTMRPVTDRLRVSREKLAYIVDSTAAPVSCLAFVTTWIGYEVGLIGEAIGSLDGLDVSAYSVFLSSVPYSFYPILAIFFVFLVAFTQRDFGPMYAAEVRARTTGKVLGDDAQVDEAAVEGKELLPKEGQPQRAVNAILPILVLVGSVLASLYVTGLDNLGASGEHSLRDIVGAADSYKSLMWGSLLGVLAATGMSIAQRILTLDEIIESWYSGLKGMLFAMIILILAWSLSSITEVLHTADYLTALLGTALNPGVLPMLVFFLAAATAFATGSSWGTMGILMPLVIPLAWAVVQANGGDGGGDQFYIIASTVSTVLAGAVWGDHCSPISDTTILSSMASGCDHIEHVRTQLPYALLVGIIASTVGSLATGFGFPWWAALIVGASILVAVIFRFGKPVPGFSMDDVIDG